MSENVTESERKNSISNDRLFFQLSWRLTIRYLMIYLIAGSIWIGFSDAALYAVFNDKQMLNTVSMLKGWFFMIVSCLAFWAMLRKRQSLWSSALDRLELQQKNNAEQQRILEESRQRATQADKLREQQMYYDMLTHLPNRNYLEREFTKRQHSQKLGLVYLDIDDFRYINDRHGYETGNLIIKLIADTIHSNLREADLAIRIGADEFALLIDPVDSYESLTACVERLRSKLTKSWPVAGDNIYISISFGASIWPEHGNTVEELIQNAELAMMFAKSRGKDEFYLYSDNIREQAVKHADTLAQLRRAVENEEFTVYYQPQIRLSDGQIRGVEALVRWNHPERGLVFPGDFIEAAEESGLIIPMGNQVLRQVAAQRSRWIEQGICPGIISVNISGRRFKHNNLLEVIKPIIEGEGSDTGKLEIELTETVMLENAENAIRIINEIRMNNISFALDDFGSGYASLNYLSRLPVDLLKIDMSFIHNINGNEHNQIIVKTLIELAHGLGMQVIAEGIEYGIQAEILRGLGCDFGQGYLYSRPVPAQELENMLSRGTWS